MLFNMWTKEVFVSDDQIKSDELDDVIAERIKIVEVESVKEFLGACLKKCPRERMKVKDLLSYNVFN